MVERAGGTISLQLVGTLDAIRGGAVQAAAELALARLVGERQARQSEIMQLQHEDFESHFVPANQMSEGEYLSAKDLESRLEQEANAFPVSAWVFLSVVVIGVIWAWSAHDGFFGVLGGLVKVAFVVVGAAMVYGLATHSTSAPARLREVKGRIQRHLVAARCRDGMAKLADARNELQRIERDIEHSREIVRRR